METINPCPFCRSTSTKVMAWHSTLSSKFEMYVECQECGARGPVVQMSRASPSRDAEVAKGVRSAIHWWNQAQDEDQIEEPAPPAQRCTCDILDTESPNHKEGCPYNVPF